MIAANPVFWESPFFLTLFVTCLVILIFLQKRYRSNLADRDRAISASSRISQIVLEDLDFNSVAQKIADVIPLELKFATGVLAILDEKKGTIQRIAASRTKEATEALEYLRTIGIPFSSIEIPISSYNNYMVKALRENKLYVTTSVYDVMVPVLTPEQSAKVQEIMSTKTTYVYPIYLKDRPIGVFIASTTKDPNSLSQYEQSILNNFVNLVGLSVQNSLLFTSLKETDKSLAYRSAQLAEANNRLRELDKLKDDFVSVASHELRTPMTAIRSYVWMALNKADIPLSDKLKRYLGRTLISTERLINLVNDMLNISRIESGRVEILPQTFDLKILVNDVVNEVEAKAKERNLEVKVVETFVPQVFADVDKVHQVLLNLLGNALKFTPDNGVITVSFFSDGQVVETSVTDSGVGIAKEDLSRLFQKFGRLDNSYVAMATSGGTGLGLYISKSLIELMQGKIWVKSEGLGKGTTFTFSLPVATPAVLAQAVKFTRRAEGEAKTLEPVAL